MRHASSGAPPRSALAAASPAFASFAHGGEFRGGLSLRCLASGLAADGAQAHEDSPQPPFARGEAML